MRPSHRLGAVARRRMLPFIFACVSALLLWQGWALPSQGQFGPGPGLFPNFIAAVCLALSIVLTLFPELIGGEAEQDGEPLAAAERRTVACYVAGVLLMALSVYTGFLVASVLISIVVAWVGERRPLRSALTFGVCCGLATVIGLGGLLGVDIPASAIDTALMRLVR